MAVHGTDRLGSTPMDLTQRDALRLGAITIDPATRQFRGPAGTVTVRPQVMLVFLTLADAEGGVVSRDELVLRAWSGRFVAEDSLNGAISEIRRALRTAGAVGAEIVTIPKTGYRLVHPDIREQRSSASRVAGTGLSRRWLIGAGAGAALLGGTALVNWGGNGDTQRVETLIDRGLVALRQGLPEYNAQGASAFRAATALDPNNARAWGLLALSLRAAAEYGTPQQASEAGSQAELAARRALALDRRQSDALTALALLTPSFGQWWEAEQRLRDVLAIDPDNLFAMAGLSRLLMSTGQVGAALKSLDRQAALDPLSPNLQFRRVYTLWSAGRLDEADATADRALQSWPHHPAVWFARMYTFAFTDRVRRAQAMLADRSQRPAMPPPAAELLGLSLSALALPNTRLVAQAVRANVAAAARGPAQAVGAIMVLSGLGAASEAYEVARGFLLQRGDVVVRQRHSAQQPSVTDLHHRMTMMLWIPVTRTLREEPRFPALCEELGLVDYWRQAGVRPDLPVGPPA